MKRKSVFAVVLAAIFVFTFAQTSMATSYTVKPTGTGGSISGYGPYQSGNGGEFTLEASTNLQWVLKYYNDSAATKTKDLVDSNTFQSFCLERNEYIYANQIHDATMSLYAGNGGQGGATGNKDYISIGTAWLYSNFVKGTLAGYNYIDNPSTSDNERQASAALLQNTFWWLEEESHTNGGTNIFGSAVLSKFGSMANARANSNGAFGIKVLNLTQNGALRQDVLVATPIPAPVLLLGAGLAGLVGLRKRAKK